MSGMLQLRAVSGGSGSAYLSGLVGGNDGAITQAYAEGAVSDGSNSADIGGLVGYNNGTSRRATGTR